MCFKGTAKRPKAIDISRELDAIGAHYNAFTSQEYTGYYAKSDPKRFDTILDVVSDMYLNPAFDLKEIEKEKGVIIEEINMYEDLPHQHVQDMFMELFYGDQPAGWNIAGTKDSVKGLTREDLVAYRAEHYVASATTIVVAGQFDESTVLEKIKAAFSGIGAEKKGSKVATLPHEGPRVMLKFKETDQTHLVLGVKSFPYEDPRNPAVRVLSTVLGGGMSSRLFQKLRDEMGVCYYVSAGNDTFTDHGHFGIAAGVDNKRVMEVISAIVAELGKLMLEDVPADELRKAKDYLAGNLHLGLETSDSVAEFYGYQQILRKEIREPEESVAKLEAVTAADVRAAANEIFAEGALRLALVGRFKDEAEFLPLLSAASKA
jgi:predicted Zn-dependent peptidase